MVRGVFDIVNGKMNLSDLCKEDIRQFCAENDGKAGEITITLVDEGPRYYQHKYYRGYLLPAIADESYSGDRDQAHTELKKMFLMQPATGWNDIPKKHRSRCSVIYVREITDDGEVTDVIRGYVPSTSRLNKKDMAEYILKIEALCAEYGIHISLPTAAIEYRRKALENAA
jgi:hypothetical protein